MTFDCIIFYNEIDLLKIRLAEHKPYVDRFIICETATDFHGNHKPTHEAEIMALPYPITYCKTFLPVGNPFDMAVAWRNSLKQLLINEGAMDADTIICTDVDEILRLDKYEPSMGLVAPQLRFYYYFVNLSTGGFWTNGFIAPYGFVKDKDFTDLRYNSHHGRNKWKTGVLPDAGWHFAWMGGVDVIKDKYRNFGQAEGWDKRLGDTAHVEKLLRERRIFHNNQQLQIVNIDKEYPRELRYNMLNYAHMIYEFEK